MHSRAYVDEPTDTIRYQALDAGNQYVVYCEKPRAVSPMQMRATGKTRRAAVHGKTVAFMRLSPTCKVTSVWNTCWHEEYLTEDEALQAAATWEDRVHIHQPGFMTRPA